MANKKDDDDILKEHLQADGDIDSVIEGRMESEKFKELTKSWQEAASLVDSEAPSETPASVEDAEVISALESTPQADATSDSSDSSDASSVVASTESQPEIPNPDSEEPKKPEEPLPVFVSDPDFSRAILEGKVAVNRVPTHKVVNHPIRPYVVKGSAPEEEAFTDLYVNRPKLEDALAISDHLGKLEALFREQKRAALRTKAELIITEDALYSALPKASPEVRAKIVKDRSLVQTEARKSEKAATTPPNAKLTKDAKKAIDQLIEGEMPREEIFARLNKAGKLTASAKEYIDAKFAELEVKEVTEMTRTTRQGKVFTVRTFSRFVNHSNGDCESIS